MIQIQLTTVHKCLKNLIKHVVYFDQRLGIEHTKKNNPGLNLLFPSFSHILQNFNAKIMKIEATMSVFWSYS